MKITSIKVFPVNEDKLKAYVTIVVEDSFVIRDLKIIRGKSGLFVAMPSKKCKNGLFRDIAHPLNQDIRSYLEEKIFQTYRSEIQSMEKTIQAQVKDPDYFPEKLMKSG